MSQCTKCKCEKESPFDGKTLIHDEARCVGISTSSGPTYCDICGEWPARQTERGKRCHICESREWCDEHPVPLPSNIETVKELAELGYEPAIRHLSQATEYPIPVR